MRGEAGTGASGGPTVALLRCSPALVDRLRPALLRRHVQVVGRGVRPDVVVVAAGRVEEAERALTPVPHAIRALVLLEALGPADPGRVLAAGAVGVLRQADSPDAVADGVLSVARGYLVVPAADRRALVRPRLPVDLEEEELAWLRKLADGHSVARLADETGRSERAMYRRLREVYARLRTPGRADALRLLATARLLGPDLD
jgi:DNA-binding NarL/FixJ family response regulator